MPPHNDFSHTAHGFSCLHTLSSEFLREIESGMEESVIPFYRNSLTAGKKIHASLPAFLFWADLGNPTAYWRAHQEFFQLLETIPTHPWIQFIKELSSEYGFSLLHEEERKGCFFH